MPRGSMLKFFRERGGPGGEHGGYLMWPGTVDGYPVRSNSPIAPDLRQGETEQIELAYDFKSYKFELWKPEEKQKYDAIMDCIMNGWYMKVRERELPSAEGLAIWLEWVQIYGETVTGKTPGAIANAKPITAKPGAAPLPMPTRPLPVSDISNALLGWPDDQAGFRPDPGPA